ncbi:hypothetical protein [Streptomyces sp. SLBN-8D4]|uniref:hypothetical protein n=1 Tax=Streptomyces sp. SLBN-8D4 TaxID=3377728 RepID=UPI003C7CAA06
MHAGSGLLKQIIARRAERDEREEQLVEQLTKLRAEREELAALERLLQWHAAFRPADISPAYDRSQAGRACESM